MVPAAGLPWFMTLFGRDTLITSFQELLVGPEPAAAALRALAEAQADVDDPERDAEPGKIVHELRRGKTALDLDRPLLRHRRRDAALPRRALGAVALERRRRDRPRAGAARRAARSTGSTRTATATATASSSTCAARAHGIDNQNWKDSWNSMVFHDGSLAHAPIAPVEVQGYVYDAKLRIAELARRVWGDEETAARLEREAATLRERFDAAFWLEEHGWYALGLDRDKRPVDALASNMGHLLWSGIVPAERVAEVAARLTSGPALVGLGRPHARRRRAGVRPARVPQRHGLAPRQLADRTRSRAGRPPRRGEPDRAGAPRRRAVLRVPAAGALRRLRAARSGGAGGCSQLGAAAGVGRRDAAAAPPRRARPRARSRTRALCA